MPGPEPTALPFPTRPSAANELPETDFRQALENETNLPNPAESLSPANGHAPAPAVAPSNNIRAIQLYDAYLVLETPEGMLVIDQHALHERILFEQFKARLREGFRCSPAAENKNSLSQMLGNFDLGRGQP